MHMAAVRSQRSAFCCVFWQAEPERAGKAKRQKEKLVPFACLSLPRTTPARHNRRGRARAKYHRALHDPLRRPAPLFVVPCLCAAGISLPQCGVCPASSVGSGTVGLFIINYYCQNTYYSKLQVTNYRPTDRRPTDGALLQTRSSRYFAGLPRL